MGLSRYERLERLNNYANLLSLVLLVAAMATIPVTYFSLKASLEDQIVTVATQDYDLKSITYELTLIPIVTKKAANESKSTATKKGVMVQTKLSISLAKDFDFTPVKSLDLYTKYTTYVRIQLEFNPGGCHDNKPASSFNMTSKQYDHDWCFELPSVKSKDDILSVAFVQLGYPSTVIAWGSALVTLSYNNLDGSTLFYAALDSRLSYVGCTCLLNANIHKEITSFSCTYQPLSYYHYYYTSGLYLFTSRKSVPTSSQQFPNTVTVVTFYDKQKYEQIDIVIYSLAISGLIVAGILVSVTILKLLLYYLNIYSYTTSMGKSGST